MAWNNGFSPGGYQIQQPMATQNVVQNCFMPIQVRDREDAKTYPMAANTTVSLISATMDFLWIKTTNASGTVVSFREFKLTEVVEEKPQYITKADLEAFKKELFDSLGGK